MDSPVDLWACGALGAGYWLSVIGGHNTFNPVSQPFVVIQVPWSSRGRWRAVLSYASWLPECYVI